jgi:16S rRNA pseudouridine516 synthase
VEIGGIACLDAHAEFNVAPDAEGNTFAFCVEGAMWQYHARAYLLLHKPSGFECSQKPKSHPSVYTLLPAPLRTRDVQAVGRLDQDTTGMLMFSDDGQFIHRMTSPKHEVPKIYDVSAAEDITDEQIARLMAGVVLDDDPRPVHALACLQTAPRNLRLTLTSGKYHQVKRMLAAVGNHVDALHRSRIGAFELPSDLLSGQWRWLNARELALASQPNPNIHAPFQPLSP